MLIRRTGYRGGYADTRRSKLRSNWKYTYSWIPRARSNDKRWRAPSRVQKHVFKKIMVTWGDANCECNLADIPSPLGITAYMTRMRDFIQMLGIISCKLCVGLMHVTVSSIGVAILLGVMVLLLVGRLVTFSVHPIQLKRHSVVISFTCLLLLMLKLFQNQ